jgi:hypothetical protein
MKYILKFLTEFTAVGLTKGRGWFKKKNLGAPMMCNAKSLFIAVNASLRWFNNVIPGNHKWSIIVY